MTSLYELYYGKQLKVFIYNPDCKASELAKDLIISYGHEIVNQPSLAHFAIAPLLTHKLTPEQFNAPRYGTLIFHPSLLPRHRGADAIKWAYKLGELYTGVTWFWCSEGYDTGDICEQEIVTLDKTLSPREFYDSVILPAMSETLKRILENISFGIIRRVKQNESAATYEPKIEKLKVISG